jgi:AcrR family transcriptional regulator
VARLHPNARRQAIIDATLAVARRQGFVVTVRDVTNEMGTSSGLIHHYFDSMDEVLAAAFEQAAGNDLDAARMAVAAEADPIAQLEAFVHSYASEHSDWTMQLWLDAWAEASRRPVLREASKRINGEWHALVLNIIDCGITQGAFRAVNPVATAWRLLSMLDGMALQVVAHDALISRGDVVDWATEAAAAELGIASRPSRRQSRRSLPSVAR